MQLDNGIPLHDGSPELLDKWLDRVETLETTCPDEIVKKQGLLGPKWYSAFRGEVYAAEKVANIAKSDLAAKDGGAKLTGAIKGA